MEWIIILIAVISIISNANKKKKKNAEEARRAAQQAQAFEPSAPPPPRSAEGHSARFPEEFVPPAQPVQPRTQQVTMADLPRQNHSTQTEMEAHRRAMQAKTAAQKAQQRVGTSITHVVKPVTESRHAHTESSMGGGEPCPPAAQSKAAAVSVLTRQERVNIPKLGFTRDEVVRGILYAEILGKPKALRK